MLDPSTGAFLSLATRCGQPSPTRSYLAHQLKNKLGCDKLPPPARLPHGGVPWIPFLSQPGCRGASRSDCGRAEPTCQSEGLLDRTGNCDGHGAAATVTSVMSNLLDSVIDKATQENHQNLTDDFFASSDHNTQVLTTHFEYIHAQWSRKLFTDQGRLPFVPGFTLAPCRRVFLIT